MNITSVHHAPVITEKTDYTGQRLYDKENAKVVHLVLKPGAVMPLHKTPLDVLFYVLEGTGDVIVGEEKRPVTTGDLVESPINIPHGWTNTGNGILRVLVIKIPALES